MKGALRAVVIGLCLLLGACYQYRLLAPAPDPLGPRNACQRTVHSLAWGLITRDTKATYCEAEDRLKACERVSGGDSAVAACKRNGDRARAATACEQSNAIDQVRVSTNFGYTLLSVLTLGFWSPVELTWHCSKPVEPEDEIGGELPSSGEKSL